MKLSRKLNSKKGIEVGTGRFSIVKKISCIDKSDLAIIPQPNNTLEK